MSGVVDLGGAGMEPSVDRDSRSLLPPITADTQEILVPSAVVVGDPAFAATIPASDGPAALRPLADTPMPEPQDSPDHHDFGGQTATTAIEGGVQPGGLFHAADLAGGGEGLHFDTLSVVWHAPAPKPVDTGHDRAEAAFREPGPELRDERSEPDDKDPTDGDPDHGSDVPTEADDGHGVEVAQTAIVEQDASIIVTGYVGEVVARLHIDQDVVMEQEANISFTIDGDGHFSVAIDQNTCIDQEIDIDVEIFDVDGVLHVDLTIFDSITVDQYTTIDMSIDDGHPGGTVDIDQDIALEQNVEIDIDIEDELLERYKVAVTADVGQTADVDQHAVVDVADCNGQIGMDVDATQTALVEQDTVLRADFVLV